MIFIPRQNKSFVDWTIFFVHLSTIKADTVFFFCWSFLNCFILNKYVVGYGLCSTDQLTYIDRYFRVCVCGVVQTSVIGYICFFCFICFCFSFLTSWPHCTSWESQKGPSWLSHIEREKIDACVFFFKFQARYASPVFCKRLQ